MGVDEEGTHERLKAHIAELVHPKVTEHRGRVVKTPATDCFPSFPRALASRACSPACCSVTACSISPAGMRRPADRSV